MPFIEKINSVFHRKPIAEYFAVFLIDSKLLKVAVWQKIGKQIQILKIAKEEFSGSLEELIETADKAISKASYGIPAEKIANIIFSVPFNWTEKGKIQSNYLKFLKNICVALSLKPMGFVVTMEAVARAFEEGQQVKINILLFHVASEIINLSVIEQGQIKEQISALRTDKSPAEDFFEIIPKLQVQSLPHRIVIFDSDQNLEEVKQELLKSPLTQKEKRFLHFPSVEILEENADISAVIQTVGHEIGANLTAQKEKEKEKEIKKENKEDIEKKEEKVKNARAEDIGFVYDKDISPLIIKESKEFKEPNESIVKEKVKLDFPFKKGLIIIGIFLFVIIFAVFGFWWFFTKADLILSVKASNFEDTVEVELASLKGEPVTITMSGTKEAGTTGKKKTGEKATGEVIIFNKITDGPKTFEKGTTILNGDLKYTLDETVTIASASMQTDQGQETKIFGKEVVKVTAEKFGTEYNLEENKDFSVDNYAQSSYSAHNDKPFAGGTTHEVRVISEQDRDKLLESLKSDLEKRALLNVQDKIDKEKESVLNSFVSEKIIEKKYSGAALDEEKNVSLDLKIEFATFSYQKSDAQNLIEKNLQGKIPKGLFIDNNSLTMKLKSVKEKNDTYNLIFNYKVRAIPKISIKETADAVKGMPVAGLANYFSKNSDIKNYDIKIYPSFPGIFNTMPHKAENIKIKLQY